MRALMSWADVSFFEWVDDYLFEATNLKKKYSKIVTRLHSYELFEYAPKINWDYVDKTIFVSKAMQQRFLEMFPAVEEERTVVINNTLDINRFKYTENRENQGNIGTLAYIRPVKRIYDLILAFYDIKKSKPDLRLLIGGDVDKHDKRYYAAIKELIERLDLQDKVILEGHITDTPTWFKKIDIYVNHSWWEGLSGSLLEAMASGCYPLVHFWRGANEIMPDENIYVFSDELKRKVLEYYSCDENKRRERSEKMRNIINERFGGKRQLTDLVDVVKDVGEEN